MTLKENILKACKARGWSISRLARETKIPVTTIHGWTAGRRSVDLEQLRTVASALRISIHELSFGVPDPNESVGEEVLKELFSGDVRVTVQKIERRK